MIGRAVWWFSVRFLAWALSRGVTIEQAAGVVDKSFPHRDIEWRARLLACALDRNQARAARSLSA